MKNNKLAIYGGKKIILKKFKRYNSIGKEEIIAANKVLKTGILSDFIAGNNSKFLGGSKVKEFEKYCAKYFKVKYAVTVNSWTSGLVCAVGAIDIEPGDEVIVTPWTMPATATAIIHWNAIPVFADIDKDTFNISPKSIIKNISKKTKAIIAVDIFGQSAEIDKIMKIAKKYNLSVIEDAADSLGSKYRNKQTGTFGKIGVFSFNGNKTITSGSGGAIVTNEKKIYLKAKHLISVSKKNHSYEFIHDQVGWNYRMNNLNASLGLSQMKKLNKILRLKKKIAYKYKKAFSGSKYCEIINSDQVSELNNWINLLKIKDKYNKKKNNLLNFLVKKGFFCRAIWRPMHLLPYLKNYQRSQMKNTMKLYRNTICLPSSANLLIK